LPWSRSGGGLHLLESSPPEYHTKNPQRLQAVQDPSEGRNLRRPQQVTLGQTPLSSPDAVLHTDSSESGPTEYRWNQRFLLCPLSHLKWIRASNRISSTPVRRYLNLITDSEYSVCVSSRTTQSRPDTIRPYHSARPSLSSRGPCPSWPCNFLDLDAHGWLLPRSTGQCGGWSPGSLGPLLLLQCGCRLPVSARRFLLGCSSPLAPCATGPYSGSSCATGDPLPLVSSSSYNLAHSYCLLWPHLLPLCSSRGLRGCIRGLTVSSLLSHGDCHLVHGEWLVWWGVRFSDLTWVLVFSTSDVILTMQLSGSKWRWIYNCIWRDQYEDSHVSNQSFYRSRSKY